MFDKIFHIFITLVMAIRCFWKHARQAHSCSWSSGGGCTCWCASCSNQSRSSATISLLIKDIITLWAQSLHHGLHHEVHHELRHCISSLLALSSLFSHILAPSKLRSFGLAEALNAFLFLTNERADNIRTSKPIRKHITLYSTLLIQNSQRWGPLGLG